MKLLYFDTERRVALVELTRRNLEVLLAKLDDPESRKTLFSPVENHGVVEVRAVENEAHYGKRAAGAMLVHGEMV